MRSMEMGSEAVSKKLSPTQLDVLRHCTDKFWVGYLGWCSPTTAQSLVRMGYFKQVASDEFQITDKGKEKQRLLLQRFKESEG